MQSNLLKSVEETSTKQTKHFDDKFEALVPKLADDISSKHSSHIDRQFETMKTNLSKMVEDIKLNLSDYCKQIEDKLHQLIFLWILLHHQVTQIYHQKNLIWSVLSI